jgi:hypothetical protein
VKDCIFFSLIQERYSLDLPMDSSFRGSLFQFVLEMFFFLGGGGILASRDGSFLIWVGAICLQAQGLAAGGEGSGDEQGAVAGAAGFLHLDCGGAAIFVSVLLVSENPLTVSVVESWPRRSLLCRLACSGVSNTLL